MAIPYYNILNMFGGSGFGCLSSYGNFGSLGGFGMGGSLFTNCLGDFDYDAAAGYGVANAIWGVAAMAINQSVSNKRAEKAEHENNKAEIENIDKQISDLRSTKAEEEIDSSYDKNIETARNNLSNAEQAWKNAQELEAAYNTDLRKEGLTEAEKTEIRQKIENLKVDEKEKEYKKLNGDEKTEGSVKYYEAEKKKAIETKQAEIDRQIKDLEAKKAKLQEAVENVDLDKADGTKLTRTSDEKYAEKLVDGKVDKSKSYTEKDIRTAIMHFSKEIDGTPEKLQKAQNVYDMYSCIPESDKNSTMKRAVEIAYNYIKEHKTEE